MRQTTITLAILGGLLGQPSQLQAQVTRWLFGGETGRDWNAWTHVNTMVDLEAVPGSLQPFELDPEENLLTRMESWARFREPRIASWRPGMPRIWYGWGSHGAREDPRILIDGDIFSGWAYRNYGTYDYFTLDLAAPAPVERLRFIPMDGVDELTDEPFRPNFARRNYEVSGGGDRDMETVNNEERLLGPSNGGDYGPLRVFLAHVENNVDFEAEVRFPLQYLRVMRYVALPDNLTSRRPPLQANSGYGELELYGRGFVPRATWESRVVDLGKVANLGQVQFAFSRWRREEDRYVQAPDAPSGVRIEIKSGLDEDPTAFYTYNEMGKLVETTELDWGDLKTRQNAWNPPGIGWRGPIGDDTERWSSWSAPMRNSGQRPRLPRGRFIKLRVQLETERLWEFARVESLVVVTSPLLASRVVGEVAVVGQLEPEGNVAQVPAGQETEFIYDVRAEFTDAEQAGFDALRLSTPSRARLTGLEMGDPPASVEPDSIVEEDSGFSVYLPRPIVGAGDNRLRLRLQTTLYDAAAEVAAEAFERSGESLPQEVEPGDATEELGTNQLRVLALSTSLEKVLGAVRVQPPAMTPQGDGVNDQVRLTYTLFSVRSTQVEISVHTLDGGSVRRLFSGHQSAGPQTQTWDGRDGQGQLVPPGLYLLRADVQTEEGSFSRLHPVAVAY